MMKSLTAGLGVLTILAVTGAMTPSGQAMLGFRSAPQNQQNVAVIKDAPASAGTRAAPAPKAVTPAPTVSAVAARPASAAARTAAPRPVPAAQRAPAPAQPDPVGSVVNVANILLNLPQVLSQTKVGPLPGNGSWTERQKTQQGDDH
mgnify:CR=1 FL=1